MQEREAALRALQEKEQAIADQIARQTEAYKAQSKEMRQAHMAAEKERDLRRKGVLPPPARVDVAFGDESDEDEDDDESAVSSSGSEPEADEEDGEDEQREDEDEESLAALTLELDPPNRGTRIDVATSVWWNIDSLQVMWRSKQRPKKYGGTLSRPSCLLSVLDCRHCAEFGLLEVQHTV